MNTLRNWTIFLVAAASLAFGGLANAGPTKQWSIAVAPTLLGSSNAQVTITIKNETPNGNSNINSLHVQLPTGYSLDTGDHSGAPGTATAVVQTTWTGALSWTSGDAGVIALSNMSPLKPQTQFTMTAYVNIAADSATCTNSAWSGDAWTGSGFTGNLFNLIASTAYTGATANTQLLAGGALAFSTPPSNVVLPNPPISNPPTATVTATVSATACSSTPASGEPIQITVTDPSGANTVLTTSTTTGSDGTAGFSANLGVGSYLVTASSSGFTPVSAQVTVFDGKLACGDSFASTLTNPLNMAQDQPGYATGSRGGNKDGSTCPLVPYTFTNTILVDNTVHLSWDASVQPNAAFAYTMNWQPQIVNPSNNSNTTPGWPVTPRPGVAWITDANANPIYVPALACLSNSMPAQYGTLASPIGSADPSSTTITVKDIKPNPASSYAFPIPGAPAIPTDPSSTPSNLKFLQFPIVIANAGSNGNATTTVERLQVTAASIVSQDSNTGLYTMTFKVNRGQAMTSSSAAHSAGFKVMSTPLPIIPNDSASFPSTLPAGYQPGHQADMCVADHGFQAYGLDTKGNPQVMYWTTVIDIGDGYVKGSF
ncbi:MAG: hypothetical protein KGJ25_12695 [Betaproteobacteria bacterium]|nr:hypothetical protein [Betaproteobacteria bacterium]